MQLKTSQLPANKHIALVAHDHKKADLLAWCQRHHDELTNHSLYGTGTTGALIERDTELAITKLISGPLGGDQQIGALITEAKIHILIFFWDPFEPMPHDPDVKALLRIAAAWNIPVACNEASADFLLNSSLINQSYDYQVPDYDRYMSERGF